ncbi:family 1 glycosylhydrolase, partial [Nonomuraea angiospora]|uniref:family 1 glycosylhydrolase n=1 Tax=Nonomuraea angiospora TaxID=46172 RepID=UPI00341DC6A7
RRAAAHHIRTSHDREETSLIGPAEDRFGIEPSPRFQGIDTHVLPAPGTFSRAQLAHYRRMIDTAVQLGLKPVVTLHRFTHPIWFGERGGWLGDGAVEAFSRFAEQACTILDGVEWVCTINEPNIVALNHGQQRRIAEGKEYQFVGALPDAEIGETLIAAHRAVAPLVREATGAKAGWTVAKQALVPAPGWDKKHAEVQRIWEDMYLEPAREDDFVGVQSYTRRRERHRHGRRRAQGRLHRRSPAAPARRDG